MECRPVESANENLRNSKPISLEPLRPEDATRAALVTPPPPSAKKPRHKKAKKGR
jgi:hypothetical protein